MSIAQGSKEVSFPQVTPGAWLKFKRSMLFSEKADIAFELEFNGMKFKVASCTTDETRRYASLIALGVAKSPDVAWLDNHLKPESCWSLHANNDANDASLHHAHSVRSFETPRFRIFQLSESEGNELDSQVRSAVAKYFEEQSLLSGLPKPLHELIAAYFW